MSELNDEYYMRQAIALANSAGEIDEVPVGALIVKDGEIIIRARLFVVAVILCACGEEVKICSVKSINAVLLSRAGYGEHKHHGNHHSDGENGGKYSLGK